MLQFGELHFMRQDRIKERKQLAVVTRKFEELARNLAEDTNTVDDENGYTRNFTYFIIYQEALEKLALDNNLTRSVLRVLLFMWGKLDYGNKVNITQIQIATALKMQPSLVSKALKYLREKEIVVYQTRDRLFYFNQELVWRGSVEEYDKYKRAKKFELFQQMRLAELMQEEELKERVLREESVADLEDQTVDKSFNCF